MQVDSAPKPKIAGEPVSSPLEASGYFKLNLTSTRLLANNNDIKNHFTLLQIERPVDDLVDI